MAAVVEQKEAAAKAGSRVDEQIAQATSRIRAHDLTFGGLALLALVLVYAITMIVLDRYLNLPIVVRQAALAGFVALFGGTAYLTLVSPLRKRINPLYAAKQVERTIEDPKNSVTGYVDAQEKGNLNPTVKAALASRAAKAAAEADVNKAVDHRSLIYLGGVSVALVLALVVLFFVFRPAQFASLVGRAFVPFSSGEIKGRTELTVTKPDPVEPTITTGQSITVAVYVGGKVPRTDSPDKVRLLIRHNPNDPNYDELPMVPAQGATNRDWELRVPDYLVQNGFWYKVAAGDAVTPEYKVTVRSLPMFTDFQTTYEYPKYLRRKPETTTDPVVRAYRGTTVTLVAKANRELRDGLMVIEPSNTRVAGVPVAGKPDSLQFVFKVTESGKYKLTFTATNGERSADPFNAIITAETDAAPIVTITKPEDDPDGEIPELPLNGLLKLDGKIGDDFGIDTVTLKMKVVGALERPLPDVPYMNGKNPSFRREKDDTWPTDLDYKGSVDLAKLKKDAANLPFQFTPGMEIEYWLEATDNCTEPKPNVGRSAPKRVRLTAPKTGEMEQEQLNREKEGRKNEEKNHADQQQKQFNNEKREPQKKGQPQEKDRGDKGDAKNDVPPEPKEQGGMGDMNNMGSTTPKNPPDPSKKGDNTPNMGPMGDPMQPPKGPNEGMPMGPMPPMGPMGPMDKGMQPDTAPMPKDPADKNLDKTAEELRKELDKPNQDGGGAKPNNTPADADRTDAGSNKPQPPPMGMDGKDRAAEAKPEPKGPNPSDPMDKGDAGTSKPQGDLKPPEDPSKPKPEPKNTDPKNGPKNAAPSEKRDDPFGSSPGTDKEQPKEPQPAPMDPNQKQDPKSGAKAKPSTEKKEGGAGGNAADKKDPADNAGARKPSPETTRGGEKPPMEPKDPPAADTKPQGGDPEAGDSKPNAAPRAGEAKPPMSKENPMPMGGTDPDAKPKPPEGNADPMNPKGGTGASETKPDDPKKPPMGGGKPVERGEDKPQPQDGKPGGGAGGGDNAPKPKLDEKQKKELEEAAKNLTSPDEKKRQDARDKLDRAVGEEKRKELEKLANDLNSPDEKTREEARRKLEAMKKEMEKQAAGKEPDKKNDKNGGGKIDEKQAKELAGALQDLKGTDEAKKKAAQEKLDKALGKSREELEQLAKDLKSDDKDKREAAEKKLEDLKKELDKLAKDGKDGKGKEPSPEEIADLAKKAQDLQSKDQKTREQAEKELDEKIGKENREKLQKELQDKKLDPKEIEQLKKEVEQMAKGKEPSKKPEDDINPKAPGQGTQAKGPMEEDAKNRLKTAELNLDEFRKEENQKLLQNKQGWTEPEFQKFLKDYEDYVDRLRKDVARAGDKPPVGGPPEPGALLKGVGPNGKVDSFGKTGAGKEGVGGPSAPAPGFEGSREKFLKALENKKP